MRKGIAVIFCFMLICFLIPNCFVRKHSTENKIEAVDKIKLLLTETSEVIEISLEDYLKGVLVGEMPATYEIEALKAQAVVARTYTLHKLQYAPGSHENADMCDNVNHCQAYKSKQYALDAWDDAEEKEKWDKIEKAVNDTKGEVITYQGELINAFFHAHSGGQTEDAAYIWGQEKIPYLKSVAGNESYLFEDSKTFSKEELKKIIKEKYADYNEELDNIAILDHTISERAYHVRIGNLTLLGTDVRTLLGLRSTKFEIVMEEDKITLKTTGYGHGVGMSQEGANNMALSGSNYQEIICHYYTGVEISTYNH
ncbi:MAG: stage II sporulation protein D [Clostridia bacterium]|nr:stage II sporulation protein D [Clostridia bacterium]